MNNFQGFFGLIHDFLGKKIVRFCASFGANFFEGFLRFWFWLCGLTRGLRRIFGGGVGRGPWGGRSRIGCRQSGFRSWRCVWIWGRKWFWTRLKRVWIWGRGRSCPGRGGGGCLVGVCLEGGRRKLGFWRSPRCRVVRLLILPQSSRKSCRVWTALVHAFFCGGSWGGWV